MLFSCLFSCLCLISIMFSRPWPCEIKTLLTRTWESVMHRQQGFKSIFCDNNFSLIVIADRDSVCSRYSASLYETWTETVGDSSQYNLSLPLISRDPATRLISVNFNPQVFTSGPRKTDPRQAVRCVAACTPLLSTG